MLGKVEDAGGDEGCWEKWGMLEKDGRVLYWAQKLPESF